MRSRRLTSSSRRTCDKSASHTSNNGLKMIAKNESGACRANSNRYSSSLSHLFAFWKSRCKTFSNRNGPDPRAPLGAKMRSHMVIQLFETNAEIPRVHIGSQDGVFQIVINLHIPCTASLSRALMQDPARNSAARDSGTKRLFERLGLSRKSMKDLW